MARYRAGSDVTDDELLRQRIENALIAAPGLDLAQAAEGLLKVLGYGSERRPLEQSGRVDDFVDLFPAPKPDTRSEGEFREHATDVQVLFQFTGDEIPAEVSQGALFEVDGFDKSNAQSFMFAAVNLSGSTYPRGPYARFTREINKRLRAPTVVLFRTAGGRLTLAFVHRRPHRRDPARDVLGSVSLIREVDPGDLHRAHVDILVDLSIAKRIKWMDDRKHEHNFDGLLAAWLYTLDAQELTKRFYDDLKTWFDHAVQEADFPKDQPKTLKPEEHVVRLITRLMFVWFVKEKKLIAGDLFIEEQVGSLLKGYDRATGDSYYRAVLQNLFFATLNTQIKLRGFSKGGPSVPRSKGGKTHRNFSLYRHKHEISDPGTLRELFDQTPFINGGLFDCLDSEEATGDDGWRIDCFSDNPKHRDLLCIPNRLFFGKHGLIDIFNGYKFTVEENTPIEQEVALDPELLGKVFEELLAEYNLETGDPDQEVTESDATSLETVTSQPTHRKQTGSYYTPRAVVDYMVDEALVESLATKTQPAGSGSADWRKKLHSLLDYGDTQVCFKATEAESLVRAIAQLKVLDPAVGSGAFPMSVLHKLTLALRRLDPKNTRWAALQKELAVGRAEVAFDTINPKERGEELKDISDTFERYQDSDFGRKLYLIQNSIYGVDIQPVACQIAKLRFFISLAIEQTTNGNPDDNYGVKPLPNLETRFVAANTLLALDRPVQMLLGETRP